MAILPATLLEEMTRRLVAEFQPEEIYLFGSHAWGTPSADSDLDLFVVVPASRGQRAQVALMELAVAKDVLVRTRAEVERLRHVPASLTRQILQQGRRIYG